MIDQPSSGIRSAWKKQRVKRAFLAVCMAVAICAGCGPTYNDRMMAETAREMQEFDAALDAKKAAIVRENNRLFEESAACYRENIARPIGSTEPDLRTIRCKPDDINTTHTAAGTMSQWVFRLSTGTPYYLYYRNGKLEAVQF
jgi:hypothetical protein